MTPVELCTSATAWEGVFIMSRGERPGLGNVIETLSARITEVQREIADLRRDVRTLIFLVREGQQSPSEHPESNTKNQSTEPSDSR